MVSLWVRVAVCRACRGPLKVDRICVFVLMGGCLLSHANVMLHLVLLSIVPSEVGGFLLLAVHEGGWAAVPMEGERAEIHMDKICTGTHAPLVSLKQRTSTLRDSESHHLYSRY